MKPPRPATRATRIPPRNAASPVSATPGTARHRSQSSWLIVATLALLASLPIGHAAALTLDRPADREFVRDLAGLLSPAEAAQIRRRCDQLLTDAAVPVFVVTLDRLADHGGTGRPLESAARTLFEHWSDSHPLIHGQDWSRGILLIVALQDRKVRVQLGPSWDPAKNALCRQIADTHIIPAFRGGHYSRGITAGVTALDAMARDQPLPKPPLSAAAVTLWAGVVLLAALTIGSFFHKGTARLAGRATRAALTAAPGALYRATRRGSDQPAPLTTARGATGTW